MFVLDLLPRADNTRHGRLKVSRASKAPQTVLSGGIEGEGKEVRAVCCHSLAMYRAMHLQALVTIFVLHADNRGSEVTDQDVVRNMNK